MKRLAIISLLAFAACNPVKKVLNDKSLLDKVAIEVVKKGYCITDTVTIQTSRDSIVYKDSIIESTIQAPCADFDTLLKNGTHIAVRSGVLTYSQEVPQKETTRTITVTNSIRDISLENILKSDITKRDSTIKSSQQQLDEAKKENKKLKWKLIALIAAALIIIFRNPIIKLATLI
jgi:hypothetical protein